MSIPFDINSREYFEHLQILRDGALEKSYWSSKRLQVGKLACGMAMAGWRHGGNRRWLNHGGIQIGSWSVPRLPTTLRVFGARSELGIGITEFNMNLDVLGAIYVHRSFHDRLNVRSALKAHVAKISEQNYGLLTPSAEDLSQLYEEMNLGASGLQAETKFQDPS